MKHLPGGRTSAVMICPSCSHSFEAVFCEPLGREGRALRGEVARLVEEVRSIGAAALDAARLCALNEACMQGDHEAAVADLEARLAHCEARLQEEYDRIMDLERRLAEYGEGHNPDDMVLIAALGAEAAALRKKIMYYENLNSRQGMPSQLKGAAKKFDEEIARSCRRNGWTDAPIGPPIGRRGRSHHAKADAVVECGPAGSCRRCSPVAVFPIGVVSKLYREFEDGANVLRTMMLRKHYVECHCCWEVTGPPGAPDIEGTWFGPLALARIVGLYLARGVDRETAGLIRQLYGFETSANSLWNGRRAVARELGPFMDLLEELILASAYVHADETRHPRAIVERMGRARMEHAHNYAGVMNGVIYRDSRLDIMIQLADIVAYVVHKHHRKSAHFRGWFEAIKPKFDSDAAMMYA